jgi:hypothetical protein
MTAAESERENESGSGSERETVESVAEAFADPAPEYGPVPLWWWDGDELDPERMTEQLEALAEGGVTGVCFISKLPNGPAGNTPRYFTEAWWDAMEHAVAECDRLGMELWVHDETYHHSPPTWWEFWQDHIRTEASERPELRGTVLHRESADVAGGEAATLTPPESVEPLLAAAYPRHDDGSLDLEAGVELAVEDGTATWEGREGAWHVTVVGRRPEGLCYTDEATVERYLDLHYEEYVRRLGDAVGDVLVGTFEDELHVLDEAVPFDDRVRERFRSTHGYDPVEHLVALYEETDRTAEFRADYYDAVVSLLEENWFEPLYEWHEKHDLLRAHDNWGRNDLAAGTEQYGDYYRTMRWYQAPGYDDGGASAIGERNFFDAKLAASVAACYDRDRVWGELFHSTTWGFRPASQLAGLVENFCYGCTLYDKHGCYYTTKGGWWAHAPPDVHFRQPYWEDVGDLNAAAHRLSRAMSAGTPVVDAALAFPVGAMHADWHPEAGVGAAGEATDEATRDLAATLYESGTDLVLADHESLDGAVAGDRLAIEGMEIPALVLPPASAVRAETLATARDLIEGGGLVVAVGGPPETVVGGDDDLLAAVFGDGWDEWDGTQTVRRRDGGGVLALVPRDGDVRGVVAAHVDPDLRRDAPEVYAAHRRLASGDVYLLFNARDEARTVEVGFRSGGVPERWDPLTGEREPIREFGREEGYTTATFEFEPHGFALVALRRDGDEADRPRVRDSADGFEVTGVTESGVEGYHTAAGAASATAVVDGAERETAAERGAPTVRDLSEDWAFDLEPALDNERGDFRYPPSEETLGAEVREFAYRFEAPGEDGREQGWAAPGLDDGDWERTAWSYGPGFWRKTGTADGPGRPPSDPDAAGWERYDFSEAVGKPGTHPYLMGYMSVVSDDYLVSPAPDTRGESEDERESADGGETDDARARTYFWTTVTVPEPGIYLCHYGPGVESLHVGDREVEAVEEHAFDWLKTPDGDGAGDTVSVRLPAGRTAVTLTVEPGVETYFAVDPEPGTARDRDLSYVPRVRWFHGAGQGDAHFDAYPWIEDPVGWYRFAVPVGATAFALPVRGGSDVWVDGEPATVDGGRVELAEPADAPRTVAVRVEHEAGAYAGAAWTGPVRIETGSATVDAGDWRDLGLDSYSGRATYRRTVDLPALEEGDQRVTLDLGEVVAAATVRVDGERAGSTFAPPYRVDLTDAVAGDGGEHVLEVEVANTLANHFAAETPRKYREILSSRDREAPLLAECDPDRQFAGGLHGPVTLRIEPAADLALE